MQKWNERKKKQEFMHTLMLFYPWFYLIIIEVIVAGLVSELNAIYLHYWEISPIYVHMSILWNS